MASLNKVITEAEQLPPGWDITLPAIFNPDNFRLSRINWVQTLLLFTVFFFLINQYLVYRINNPPDQKQSSNSVPVQVERPLTAFDETLVNEQKKNSSGQVSTLDSQHIHADFKVYVNGQAIDFAKQENYLKARFVHLDPNPQNNDDAASVLHIHAQYVPVKLFFESIGMKLEQDSLTLQDGQTVTKSDENTLKYFLNGQQVDELGNYTPQDLDKLLISFGPANDPDIERQLNSVTNYAKDH